MLPFLTAFDPVGGSAGSIDPLGALQTYGSLADLLLPGVTTITTRSRYLSMMCAALANAEKHLQLQAGPSGRAQRRRAVEPFERLWALGCVAAREAGAERAADGLRGITYAEKGYRRFASSGGSVNCNFPLLKFQARTGAVGTYWTAMVEGQLVHEESGGLTKEGSQVASQFPELPLRPRDQRAIAGPGTARTVSLQLRTLQEWGGHCHLQAASTEERRLLGEALTADDRRECICRALAGMGTEIPETWTLRDLRMLSGRLAALPRAVELGLPVVLEAVVAVERFHESVLATFGTLLWWGTQPTGGSLEELLADGSYRRAADHCFETANNLCEFREGCGFPVVRTALDTLSEFSIQVSRCRSGRELVAELLGRHHRVQSGKLHGGIPKRDWISLDGNALLRPAPRFQRRDRPALPAGEVLTHPYRFEQFVFMLRENHLLSQN